MAAENTGAKKRFEPVLVFLRDPVKLRVTLTLMIGTVWYFAVYSPMADQIEADRSQVAREERRTQLIHDIETLEKQVDQFQDKLPEDSDTNEWLQYLLAGSRKFPVHLTRLDTEPVQDAGPFKVVRFRVSVEGQFHDLDSFMNWLEDNPRLLRIDSINLATGRSGNDAAISAQLTLLGLMGTTS